MNIAADETHANGQVEEPAQPTVTAEKTLQLRYVDLLEKRIAQLEKAVGESDKPSGDQAKKDEVKGTTVKKDATEKDGKAAEASDAKPHTRYRSIRRQWNPKTEAFEDLELDSKKTNPDDDRKVAFTFRRVYLDTRRDTEEDNSRSYSEIDVEACGLKNLLKKHIGTDYPGQSMEGDKINMVAPFHAIVSFAFSDCTNSCHER